MYAHTHILHESFTHRERCVCTQNSPTHNQKSPVYTQHTLKRALYHSTHAQKSPVYTEYTLKRALCTLNLHSKEPHIFCRKSPTNIEIIPASRFALSKVYIYMYTYIYIYIITYTHKSPTHFVERALHT